MQRNGYAQPLESPKGERSLIVSLTTILYSSIDVPPKYLNHDEMTITRLAYVSPSSSKNGKFPS